MASYTQRMVSIAQAIKSTTPNVARKAPLALDPPCSVVISHSQESFRLHERGLADPVSLAPPWRSRWWWPPPGRRDEDPLTVLPPMQADLNIGGLDLTAGSCPRASGSFHLFMINT